MPKLFLLANRQNDGRIVQGNVFISSELNGDPPVDQF